jgi:thiol-disulfide isomerase/thioredoxin
LAVVRNQSQLLIPIYFGDAKSAVVNVKIDGRSIIIDDTPDNRALTTLGAALNALDRRLWMEEGLNGTQMTELILGYKAALDSLDNLDEVSPAVYEYMKVMAYVRAFNAYSSIPRAQQIPSTSIPFSRDDVLPLPVKVLDNDYASLFYATSQIVRDELPSMHSLLDRLAYLYAEFSNNSLRMCVATAIMKDFIFNYNYSADFDSGLALVKKATEKYGFPSIFVDEFMKRKSTVVGSPFPEGVTLVDAEGKVVDMSQFKGKYVYIDLWASWCGPCCKEVPYLKKLEKELKNKDVVFVSVSSDTNEQAWKSKMKELDMHGHQYLDKGNTLCDALNVKGIPFFVIYDKAGNLYTYGAMRPSSGARLRDFLENLH